MKINFKAKYSHIVDANISQTQKLFKKKFNEEIEIISDNIFINDEYDQMREMEISDPLANKRPGVRYLGSKKYEDGVPAVFQVTDDLKLYEQEDRCDHCKKNRNRNLYHFFEENEKIVMIGSSCSEEYFGYNCEALICRYWAFIQELISIDEIDMDQDNDGCSRRDRDFIDTDRLVIMTIYSIKKWGFISKQNEDPLSGRFATANDVSHLIYDKSSEIETMRNAALLSKDDALNSSIKDQILIECEKECETSFDYNTRENWTLLAGEKRHLRKDFPTKRLGLAVYTIYRAYLSLTQTSHEEHTSEWVGQVGERTESEVKILGAVPFSHAYGTGTVVRLEDTSHNRITWFSTKPVDFVSDIGKRQIVKFTIKKHDEYKDSKVTLVTRLKTLSTLSS